MRENRTSGSVRGVPGNRHSYRGYRIPQDILPSLAVLTLRQHKQATYPRSVEGIRSSGMVSGVYLLSEELLIVASLINY